MLKRGKAPFLECSTRGDRRFSAFVACINGFDRDGKSIETIYQAYKVFDDGSTGLHWRDARGRKAVNAEECATLYTKLWRQYMSENPDLWEVLEEATGLSDMFGKEGNVCQADVLWTLKLEREKSND